MGEMMGRSGYRATLENGLKLDINSLARRGFIKPGATTGPIGIQWTNSYWGHVTGVITANMRGPDEGWFNIKIGELNQPIDLRARQRHFGGRQWFFLCPRLDRLYTVLWRPPGAAYFACRQKWARQVAYASQFLDRDNRAHRGKALLNARLCRIGGFDTEDWISRRSRNGCDGQHTDELKIVSTDMKQCLTRAFWSCSPNSSGADG
jgi:hypothetical protein